MKANSYKKYLLFVLAATLAFNQMDRYALALVLQDIKVDLALSDTQLGVLTGIAFAAFYSIAGIPIARWADRGNRITIISASTALWCAAVAMCGVVKTFSQLLLIRVVVAIGEAGCTPPAHSLIADTFTRAERPRAVARYMLGGAVSVLIGFLLAGWLNEFLGWRTMFVVLGAPGLGLAALAWLTLKEPRRGGSKEQTAVPVQMIARDVFWALWRVVTLRRLLIAYSIMSFFNYGIVQWKPAFFVRSFGLETGTLGTWLAMIYGIAGFCGMYAGGELASRFAAGNERLQLRWIAAVWAGFGLVAACVYLAPNYYIAFALTGLTTLASAAATAPLFATIQTIVPQNMRATSIALIYLFSNLIGMGLGPLAAGVLSDAFRHWAGEESLRYALLTLCPGYLLAAWYVWRAGRTVTGDVQHAYRQSNLDSRGELTLPGASPATATIDVLR
jgi:MFS family permease